MMTPGQRDRMRQLDKYIVARTRAVRDATEAARAKYFSSIGTPDEDAAFDEFNAAEVALRVAENAAYDQWFEMQSQ